MKLDCTTSTPDKESIRIYSAHNRKQTRCQMCLVGHEGIEAAVGIEVATQKGVWHQHGGLTSGGQGKGSEQYSWDMMLMTGD